MFKDNKINKAFGLAVRTYRFKARLTQIELAERADIHPTYLSDVEHGKKDIGLRKIVAIARGLGVSPKDLMPE